MPRRANLLQEKDRRFRVRIKFAIPKGGIRRLTEIHLWLKDRFGPSGFAVTPAAWEGNIEAFAVHIDDAAAAPDVRAYIDDAIANPQLGHLDGDWGYSME
jgi:hypothetical protein